MFTVTIGAVTTTLSCELVETMAAQVSLMAVQVDQILTIVGSTPEGGQILFTIGPVREQSAPAASGGTDGTRHDRHPAG